MQYRVEEIDQTNKKFHNNVVEPFKVFGRLEVSYQNNAWRYEEIIYDNPYTKTYGVDEIDLNGYISTPKKVILYALSGNDVLGQIVIRKHWNKFCFIDDIAVRGSARQKGVASSLIDHAQVWATQKNLKGLMLETQDINLAACRLYIKRGFILGSIDTMLYSNFESKDEKALFWYKKFSE